jgi:hypothetical protein
MDIKFNYKPKEEKNDSPKFQAKGKPERRHENEQLKRIYENPKTMLRKSLEVIEMAVQEQLETLINDYTEWRRGRAKRPEYIFNMLQDIAFVSVLPKIVKTNYDLIVERGEEFSELLSAAVSEVSRRQPPLSKSKEMIAIYSSIYEDLNEERITRVFEMDIPGVEWADALKLCIVSHGSPGHTMNNTLRAIYTSVKSTDYDKVRKLFIKLYGKQDMGKVATYILLERAYDKQKTAWINRELHSLITNIALDELEKHPKKEIQELLKLYCNERRKQEQDQVIRRRISFSSINKDDYEKINSVVKKLVKKNEMYRTFLDHTRVR